MSNDLLNKYATYEETNLGIQDNITAYAGGGSTSATPLTKKFSIITVANHAAMVVASVILPPAVVGKEINITVVPSNTVKVYPNGTDKINNSGIPGEIIGPFGQSKYYCACAGFWRTI